MAFGGSPVVKQISDGIVRISGITVGGAQGGTIGLFGATGTPPDLTLPNTFQPGPYRYDGGIVSLQDAIDVDVKPADTDVEEFEPIRVAKSGTTVEDFRATLTNVFASETPGLEIYIRFHE